MCLGNASLQPNNKTQFSLQFTVLSCCVGGESIELYQCQNVLLLRVLNMLLISVITLLSRG